MLPDLGKYALPVLSAYTATIVLLAGLIFAYLSSNKKSKETLEKLEDNLKAKSND